jgi:hypothetical protein
MTSDSIGELAKALAAAQGEMTSASKDATNPHFKSRYATLASVWDAIRGPLSRNGLSIIQVPQKASTAGHVAIYSKLLHSSGQWEDSLFEMPIPDKLTPQAMGSAITYAKRYALLGLAGIAPDDDDDGNAASVTPPRQTPPPKPAPKQEPPSKGAMAVELRELLQEFAWPDGHKTEFANKLLAHYGTSLGQCLASTEIGKSAAFAINGEVQNWLTAHPDETRADALQTLFASIMEQAQ